jgi:hypothetical protein
MLRALGVLLFVAISSASALAQTWKEFRPEGVGYSVEMPGQWELSSQDVPTAIGPMKAYMAAVNMPTRAYMTMYMTYPADAVRTRPVDTMLDGARDGAVANVKGKLRSEQRLTINGLAAREIVIDAPNNLVVINRYFLLQATLVQALLAGLKDVESDPDTRRFLGSLKVVGR